MIVAHSNPARCIWIIFPELEIGKRRKQRRGGIGPENDSSTIDGTSREGIQVKARHDTEVELPSFERREEIRVRCSVGIDNFPAGEYNFEVDDAVTCPSTLWAEERYTSWTISVSLLFIILLQESQLTSSQKASSSDDANATPKYRQFPLLSLVVYVLPQRPRTNPHDLITSRNFNLVHALHVDCYAIIDVVEANVRVVTTSFDRKLGAVAHSQNIDGDCYIFCRCWTDNARWSQTKLKEWI